ncbi:FAD-binding oxidoreductase [Bradyrhizobium sp. Arg68]|uniref:FAD-binding oxidoreductase n=1 Tax=Bradyrhizobium ivorense TaxID=2511166 RepID=UPI001E412F09|nr:FAD-binding oxidoreductase [Bradyrhizobium ivorense]MCC8936945.1 FAD-binding oxidoreductase [Bradyrhizobium ivorense]
MTALRSIAAEAAELGNKFGGTLMQPGDAGYDEARRVHNGLINKKPALIAQCRDASDVADAVRLAQRLGLEVAVRGGGHNVAGRATIDGGVMIDLSAMKGIEVDPERRTVRAQGGVTWAELDRETQKHGLAVTGGVVSSTGIAGLTLGGGLGWLMGKYGLALDNLVSLELVNAQGELIRASKTDEPDLFWAARGGGGNFGIATTLEYQLHAVGPTITGGLIAYPFDRSRDVLSLFRERTSSLSDEQILFATLAHAPDGSGVKLAAMVTCHCGPLAAGELAMRPLRQLGTPVLDGIGPMPYCDLNSMLDAGYPKGAFNYWKSTFLRDLSDDAIRTMIECFARCPTPMGQFVVEHVHGAAVRVGIEETAFPHRQEGYNFLILTQWLDAAMTDRCIAWARDTYARMAPFAAAGRYVNYLGDDEGGDPVPAAYGPNYRRLRELKSKYDPKNFFRMNQNIRPLV